METPGLAAYLDRYFNDISPLQRSQFLALEPLYHDWNSKINLISRKDIAELALRHILHSLAIAKVNRFNPGARILDLGTGGGFPGIPLSILFPEAEWLLCDSIAKKIRVVDDIATQVGLKQVRVHCGRAEDLNEKFDYVVSRATAPLSDLVRWTQKNLVAGQAGSLPNGWLTLKGGDLSEELRPFRREIMQFEVDQYFDDAFFKGKSIIYLPRQSII